jgi:hypothetical protein
MVGWPDQNAAATNPTQVKLNLTHEEIGQMIGTSRETVSRLFAGFKKQQSQHRAKPDGTLTTILCSVLLFVICAFSPESVGIHPGR